jgi:hypothetical protein
LEYVQKDFYQSEDGKVRTLNLSKAVMEIRRVIARLIEGMDAVQLSNA